MVGCWSSYANKSCKLSTFCFLRWYIGVTAWTSPYGVSDDKSTAVFFEIYWYSLSFCRISLFLNANLLLSLGYWCSMFCYALFWPPKCIIKVSWVRFLFDSFNDVFLHDGLRITLPKMPATAQFLGQPLLIPFFFWLVPITCSNSY